MRKLLPLLLVLIVACNSNKTDKKEGAKKEVSKNKEYILSMNGLDELKIDMTQAELEKLLKQKMHLINAETNAASWQDTATVRYKDIDVILHLQREYRQDNSFDMGLTGVETRSPQVKTEKGIGIGNSKQDIIDTYADSYLMMGPEYVSDTSNEKSKTKYSIHLKGEAESREIIFFLDNLKVSAMKFTRVWTDSE